MKTFEERKYLRGYIPKLEEHMNQDQTKSIKYLVENEYLNDNDELGVKSLTIKGLIASQINECNEVTFTEALMDGIFDDLTEVELAGMLGVFSCTRIQDEDKRGNIENLEVPQKIKNKLFKLQEINNKFKQKEFESEIKINNDWDMNLDMVEYAYHWANGTDYYELGFANFEGNFVRDMIRLDNIARDVVTMAEMVGKLDLMNKASLINEKVIRDMVTVDSLYVRM